MFKNFSEIELQELLLHSARNGDVSQLQHLFEGRASGEVELDISCKGKSKCNLGWTPLHLATYFGHKDATELLLNHGADINAVNDAGDTALHKAAFIGREDLVLSLLERNADVNIHNGEGRTARDVCKDEEASKLLWAAERTESKHREEMLLAAARDGNLEVLSSMLKDERPPNINCVDSQGNTPLHCASYRGHKEAAVLLLQNGIDTNIRNIRGQTALDLARDSQTRQVLSVRPVRQLQKTVVRFEGQLLKRSRFLGWKPVWAVLERGVLTYFNSRADSISGIKRKDFKYLDGAQALPSDLAQSAFTVHFSDGTEHRLSVPIDTEDVTGEVSRQKWLTALNEHAAYSSHYLNQGSLHGDSDEEEGVIKPLGSMQDEALMATNLCWPFRQGRGIWCLSGFVVLGSAEKSSRVIQVLPLLLNLEDALQTAAARYQLLDTRLQEIVSSLETYMQSEDAEKSITLYTLKKFEEITETASSMLTSLSHCLNLIKQQEEVRVLQLKQEQEKCRVLEEALSVLAKEHHELEQSIASHMSPTPPLSRNLSFNSVWTRRPRFYDTSEDEFYDAFEADSESDTLVTAATPLSDSDTLVSVLSCASSCATLVSLHSFRSARECKGHYNPGRRIAARCVWSALHFLVFQWA